MSTILNWLINTNINTNNRNGDINFVQYLYESLSNYKILNDNQIKTQINQYISNIDLILISDNKWFIIKCKETNTKDYDNAIKFIRNIRQLVSIINNKNIIFYPIYITKHNCDKSSSFLLYVNNIININLINNNSNNTREKLLMKLYNYIISKTNEYKSLVDYRSRDILMSYYIE
jgi:hypothetical protein